MTTTNYPGLSEALAAETDRYGNEIRLSDGAPRRPVCQGALLDEAALFGRYGGRVHKAESLRKADAWIEFYGTRSARRAAAKVVVAPKMAPPKPKVAVSKPAPEPEPKPVYVRPEPPKPVDLPAVKAALAMIRGCRGADDLDAAAELFNEQWSEGWPRSVEMVWDHAFKQA